MRFEHGGHLSARRVHRQAEVGHLRRARGIVGLAKVALQALSLEVELADGQLTLQGKVVALLQLSATLEAREAGHVINVLLGAHHQLGGRNGLTARRALGRVDSRVNTQTFD